MTAKPEIIDEAIVYQNRWIVIYKKTVRTVHGLQDCYVVGKAVQIVAILAIDNKDGVYLTQQYRWAVDDTPLDIPGGGIHPGETISEAAKRELQEETGCTTARLKPLMSRYLDSGQKDAVQHIFVATGLTPGKQKLDAEEDITIVKRNIYQLRDEILAGKHKESTLMVAVLAYLAKQVA